MAIPGLDAKRPIKGKVRVGKVVNGRPQSTDFFVFSDESHEANSNTLRIGFVDANPGDVWTTTLEWWRRNQLACYTEGKESGGRPVAFRVPEALDPENEVLGELRSGRKAIVCPVSDCAHYGSRECKPKGRLVFYLVGERVDNLYQFESGAWKTIQGIEGALNLAALNGSLVWREFELSVRFEKNKKGRYPIVSLKEVIIDGN